MQGRIYDPKMSRFITPDPVVNYFGKASSLNPYCYVLNIPETNTDPTGLFGDDATGATSIGYDPMEIIDNWALHGFQNTPFVSTSSGSAENVSSMNDDGQGETNTNAIEKCAGSNECLNTSNSLNGILLAYNGVLGINLAAKSIILMNDNLRLQGWVEDAKNLIQLLLLYLIFWKKIQN